MARSGPTTSPGSAIALRIRKRIEVLLNHGVTNERLKKAVAPFAFVCRGASGIAAADAMSFAATVTAGNYIYKTLDHPGSSDPNRQHVTDDAAARQGYGDFSGDVNFHVAVSMAGIALHRSVCRRLEFSWGARSCAKRHEFLIPLTGSR